jgi:hypothetical protein
VTPRWKLTISREWTFLEGSDLANVVRPWLDFEAREFHAGRFPLWDLYEWAGHTLIGQVQPGITNPLKLPRMARVGGRRAPSHSGIGRSARGARRRGAARDRVSLPSVVSLLGLWVDYAGILDSGASLLARPGARSGSLRPR